MIGKFFMAAWRERWKTWAVGVLIFGISVFSGLTGFILQTNWDGEWIAGQAKDAMNAMGVGALINTLNTGRMLTIHIVLLPLLVIALVGIHILVVRHESPVRPIGAENPEKTEDSEEKQS